VNAGGQLAVPQLSMTPPPITMVPLPVVQPAVQFTQSASALGIQPYSKVNLIENINFKVSAQSYRQEISGREDMSDQNQLSNQSSSKRKIISIYNEFGGLNEAIVRRPIGSGILNPINEVQAHYFESDPPSLSQLLVEHQTWTNLLQGFKVSLDYLEETDDGSHNPCFTRDIGFAIGERLFLSSVVENQRKGEIATLRKWLNTMNQPHEIVSDGFIEGGDVLVDEPYVYIGIGQRSNIEGAMWLSRTLGSSWEVIPIQLEKGILHLDCVLAIISDNTIIWCPDLLAGGRQVFEKRFGDRISVTREDVFHMAANVLMINPSNVVVERRHTELQNQLTGRGIRVHSLDWREMKKFGGLFRCAICPLHRNRNS
jgi:N-dimethylarginine dimethylaminohydrolase